MPPSRFIVFSTCFCLIASCGSGYKRDDAIYTRDTNELVGTILEVGTTHKFSNGMDVPSIRFRRASDGAEVWSSRDAFEAAYFVRKK